MAKEKKVFVGGMDFDTESRYVKQGDYRAAINMKPTGENDGKGTLENILGSEFIDDTDTIQWTGANAIAFTKDFSLAAASKVIGTCRDEVYDRIIYFIRESATECSIYEYSQKQNAISCIVNKFDLDFHEDYLITGANVIAHGEPWAPDGLLYFTDNLNPPRKINIAKAKLMTGIASAKVSGGKYYSAYHSNGFTSELVAASKYSSLTQQIFDVVKYPPLYSPEVLLGTDDSYIKNSVANNQWQFKYRYVYDDKEKSAWSPISRNIFSVSSTPVGEVPLETDNYVELAFNSGTKEVESIEIAARSLTAGGDFFLVDTVRKDTTNAIDNVYAASANDGTGTEVVVSSDDTNYFFRFFNNLVYNILNLKDSIKPFDDVPLQAKSQELIDGNRIAYGNIVNGRTGVESEMSLDLLYQDSNIPVVNTPISHSVTVFPDVVDVSDAFMNYDERFFCDYTLNINLNDAITAGDSPANAAFTFSLDNMGVVYMFDETAGSNNESSYLIGALSGQLALSGVPAMPQASFYQYMLEEFSGQFPTLDSILQIAYVDATDESVIPGPKRKHGHSNGGGIDDTDGVLWELDAANGVLKLRFNIRSQITWANLNPSNGNCGWGCVFGNHDIGADDANLYSNYSAVPSSSTYAVDTYKPNLFITISIHEFPAYSPGVGGVYNFKALQLSAVTEPITGFKSNAHHEIGIVYYDKANRSSAVCDSPKQIYVPFYGERDGIVDDSPAAVKVTIPHTPPSWASTYQIVYSGNTSISDFWQFRIKNVEIIDAKMVINIRPLVEYYDESGAEVAEVFDFVKGDRIKFLEQGIDNDYLIISSEINAAGDLTVTTTSDAINGLSVVGLEPDFQSELVEIYRPLKSVDDDFRIFYEISEVHPVVGGFHQVSSPENVSLLTTSGVATTVQEQNQTGLQDAIIVLTRGDIYHNVKAFEGAVTYDLIEDFTASIYFKSDNWDAGRPNKVNADFKETRRPSTIFYSEPFIANTNINGLSSIFPDDTFEEFDKSYGSIQKLHSRENQLIIFQENKVSRAQVNRNVITTGSGDQILTAQGAVISQAIPYSGEYGISFNPESFSEYAEVIYFADVKRGAVCRLSQNGIIPVSEYQMQNYFSNFFKLLTKFDISSASNPTKVPKLYGCFNPKDKEYMLSLDLDDWNVIFNTVQASDELNNEAKLSVFFDDFGIRNEFKDPSAPTQKHTQGDSINTTKANFTKRTIVFNESLNRWTHFMSASGMFEYINNEVVNIINPLVAATSSVGGTHGGASLYVMKRGVYDTGDLVPNNYSVFYSEESGGTQTNSKNVVDAEIILVSNIEPSLNKVYNSIDVECNFKPTDFEIQNNYRQYSKIFNSYWKTKENYHYSNIYGDINSFLAYVAGNANAGIINGERIRSSSATIRCSWTNNKYTRLFAVNVGVSPS